MAKPRPTNQPNSRQHVTDWNPDGIAPIVRAKKKSITRDGYTKHGLTSVYNRFHLDEQGRIVSKKTPEELEAIEAEQRAKQAKERERVRLAANAYYKKIKAAKAERKQRTKNTDRPCPPDTYC